MPGQERWHPAVDGRMYLCSCKRTGVPHRKAAAASLQAEVLLAASLQPASLCCVHHGADLLGATRPGQLGGQLAWWVGIDRAGTEEFKYRCALQW